MPNVDWGAKPIYHPQRGTQWAMKGSNHLCVLAACECVCVCTCYTGDKPCSNYCYLQRLTLSFSPFTFTSFTTVSFLLFLYQRYRPLHFFHFKFYLFFPSLSPLHLALSFHLLSSFPSLIPLPPLCRMEMPSRTKLAPS